ncbi:MAG: galactonate dehydratase [Firmicutes bacterium]|nr:galactonate dehydratase [Bacillota bacterium]
MKIARVESFLVPPRWCFVRVESQDDWVGWGEAIIPKRARAVTGAIADLAENILGRDPDRIEDLVLRMRAGGFFRRGPVLATAMAAIEQALWDLKGHRYGLPVFQFLGGRVRDHVNAYSGIGGDDLKTMIAQAESRVQQGFCGVKLGVPESFHYLEVPERTDRFIQLIAGLRQALGPTIAIAVDFHGRVHRAVARKLAHALVPYDLLWIEEALLPEHDDLQPSVFDGIPINLATGERLVDRWAFKHVLEERRVDIVQPDASITGLFELEKIARMAEAYDVTVAPHCPNGPLCLAATLQVDAVLGNVVWQEYNLGIRDFSQYLENPEALLTDQGRLHTPTGPGLGITINEAAVRQAANGPLVKDPDWQHGDGTYAEW